MRMQACDMDEKLVGYVKQQMQQLNQQSTAGAIGAGLMYGAISHLTPDTHNTSTYAYVCLGISIERYQWQARYMKRWKKT
jgi:di/tripeptidase